MLAHRAPDRFFVLSAQRRYAPAVGDTVVGVVADRAGGAEASYKVRLHGTGVARLPELAFDGASKRNKPALAVGSVVFARVAAVGAHVDAELSCCVQSGPRRDWMTGQALFGELRGGTHATARHHAADVCGAASHQERVSDGGRDLAAAPPVACLRTRRPAAPDAWPGATVSRCQCVRLGSRSCVR